MSEFHYGPEGLDLHKPPAKDAWAPYELINSPDWYALKYYVSCRQTKDLYLDEARKVHRYHPKPDGSTNCTHFMMYPTDKHPEGRWLVLKTRQVPPTEWDGKQILTNDQIDEMRSRSKPTRRSKSPHWDEWSESGALPPDSALDSAGGGLW